MAQGSSGQPASLQGDADRLGNRPCAEAIEEIAAVHLGRPDADTQLVRGLLRRLPLKHRPQEVRLARGQPADKVTGLLPVPAGPAGAIEELTTADWLLFKHNPYPEVAKGLAEYWMAPDNLKVMIEEGDGRWGPPYKNMYNSEFWKRPVFQHWRGMLERGRTFASPGVINAASGEVLATYTIGRMMHRVLVESWPAEKAVEEAHKKVATIYARYQGG